MVVRGRVAVLEDVDGRASARGLFDEGERGARQDATSIHVRRSTPRATSIQPSEDNRRVCKPKKKRERRLTQDWRGCVVKRMLRGGCRLAKAGSRRCVV